MDYDDVVELGPNLANVAALISDPARCSMLVALLSGQAMTHGELARVAGVTIQTASFHLAKLRDGGLVETTTSGRHRYNMLAGPHVGEALESLLHLAERTGATRFRAGPKEPALRKARVCYDHLAGELGVYMLDRLVRLKAIEAEGSAGLKLGPAGTVIFGRLGIKPDSIPAGGGACRPCMDWSARRWHLAGPLGRLILTRITQLNWATRSGESRILVFTDAGERKFGQWLDGFWPGAG